MQNQEYYQIYERDHPIIDAHFQTKRQARNHLKLIGAQIIESEQKPFLFSSYEVRLKHLPVRDILFLKKLYADGHDETVTLYIRSVKMFPQHPQI